MKNDRISEIYYKQLIMEQTESETADAFDQLVNEFGFKKNASGAYSVTKYVSSGNDSHWDVNYTIMIAQDPEENYYHASVSFGTSDTWLFDCVGLTPLEAYIGIKTKLGILADSIKALE